MRACLDTDIDPYSLLLKLPNVELDSQSEGWWIGRRTYSAFLKLFDRQTEELTNQLTGYLFCHSWIHRFYVYYFTE